VCFLFLNPQIQLQAEQIYFFEKKKIPQISEINARKLD